MLAFVLCAASATYAKEQDRLLGSARWGISQEAFLADEEESPDSGFSGNDRLVFRDRLFGEDVLMEYVFVADRLSKVRCLFTKFLREYRGHQGMVEGESILDFVKIKNRLVKRYGEPAEVGRGAAGSEVRSPDIVSAAKDSRDLALMERAVRKGAAFWYVVWRAPNATIVLTLKGGEGASLLEIECVPA
jgi:hypothetical protein